MKSKLRAVVRFVMLTLFVGVMFLPPTEAAAEKRQYGNVVYEVPQGWVPDGTWDGFQVLHPEVADDKCGYCAIYIGAGVPADSTLEQFMAENRTAFIGDDYKAEAEALGEPRFFEQDGYEAGLSVLHVAGEIFIFAAANVGDQFHTFGFQGTAADEAQTNRTMEVFDTDFMPFLDTVSFVSAGAKPLVPEARRGDLTGLWWGVETRWLMGFDGMMQAHMFHTTLIFWPDGHFYRGTPPTGVEQPDSAALLASGNPDFGTYSLNGNTLTLTFADGTTETATIDGEGIMLGATALYQAGPLADGETIEGTIGAIFYQGFTPGAAATGGAYSASYTTFHPDGTYEGASSGGVSANIEDLGSGAPGSRDVTAGITSSQNTTEGGTYEIRDGLIISTPNDGSTPRILLVFRAGDSILVGDKFLETE